jgi:hypothetical protein
MISGNENIRMPQDLSPAHHRNKAMKFQDYAQNTRHSDSIDEEDLEELEQRSKPAETSVPSPPSAESGDAQYQRKGPGYSVINPPPPDEVSGTVATTAELIQTLTSNIQSMVDDCHMEEVCIKNMCIQWNLAYY